MTPGFYWIRWLGSEGADWEVGAVGLHGDPESVYLTCDETTRNVGEFRFGPKLEPPEGMA